MVSILSQPQCVNVVILQWFSEWNPGVVIFALISATLGCHVDHLRCHQWWQRWHYENNLDTLKKVFSVRCEYQSEHTSWLGCLVVHLKLLVSDCIYSKYEYIENVTLDNTHRPFTIILL